MRISGNPDDRDYVGSEPFTVVLDRQFFTAGPIIEADEVTGTIQFHPVDAHGNYRHDPVCGTWVVERVTGDVRIYRQEHTIC